MATSASQGVKKGADALKEAIGRLYLAREQPAEAVKLLTDVYVAAKRIEGASPDEVPPVADAALGKQLGDVGDRIVRGETKEAVELAKAALASARNAGDRAEQLPALKLLVAAYAANKDIDGALQASKELAKVARKVGQPKVRVLALASLADAMLASGEPGQAATAAEEAVAEARSAGDSDALLAALTALYGVHRIMGKCVSALKSAQEAVEAARSRGRRAEVSALLAVGDAHPSSPESLAAAKEAVAGFRELDDKVGEGAALIALAFAQGSQPDSQYEEGMRSALSASLIFKERGERAAEALALCTASRACALKEDTQQASTLAKDALQIYRELNMPCGEAYASDLVCDAPFAAVQQSGARLLIDEDMLAHVEISELATQESLESIIATLHNFNARGKCQHFKAIVVHVNGTPAPSRLHSYAMASGTFMVGLRSVGLPVVSCAWGTIAGPSWGLFFLGDYRIIAQGTKLVTPILRPLECLPDLVGNSNYAQLTIDHGTLTAQSMQEMGMCHQVQKDADTAQKAATEQAKRITNFPVLAARQTLCLMTPDAERYVFLR